MHITVPLAMFCLDTMTLNYDLCERAQNLKDRLIQFQVDVNRDTNTRYYCCMQGNSNDNRHNGRMKKWIELATSSNDQVELPIQLVSAPNVRVSGTLGSDKMINNKEKTIWDLE